MNKFCISCGAQVPEGTKFCQGCGAVQAQATAVPTTPVAPVPTYQQPQMAQSAPVAPTTPKGKLGIPKIAIIGAIALVVIILLANIFGGGYKNPIKNQVIGMEKLDWKKYSSSMTKEQVSKIEENFGKDEIYDDGDDYMDKMFGKNDGEISVKIIDKTKLTKDQIGDEEDDYKDKYDEEVNIKSAYIVCCKYTSNDNGDKTTYYSSVIVGKIGLKWYILN